MTIGSSRNELEGGGFFFFFLKKKEAKVDEFLMRIRIIPKRDGYVGDTCCQPTKAPSLASHPIREAWRKLVGEIRWAVTCLATFFGKLIAPYTSCYQANRTEASTNCALHVVVDPNG